jgi:hypothetical protein
MVSVINLGQNTYILSHLLRESGHFRYHFSLSLKKAKVNPVKSHMWICGQTANLSKSLKSGKTNGKLEP